MKVNFYHRPRVPGPPIPRLLVILFNFFFPSDQPTQYLEMHSTLNEKKKKKKKGGEGRGWPYSQKNQDTPESFFAHFFTREVNTVNIFIEEE